MSDQLTTGRLGMDSILQRHSPLKAGSAFGKQDMSLNPDKCSVLQVNRPRTSLIIDYFLYGQKLESAKLAKYIGVTIQTHKEINKHITSIALSVSKTLGFIQGGIKDKLKNTQRNCLPNTSPA